ncbi:MAG: voltage-gated chloride channel protein, partial [Clostridiales bacterium]|nr:voltage-gated chloride channel protein [Clostridiales bacterium]
MNKKKCITIFKLIVSSILIGLVVGAIDTVFGRVLIKITNFRQENYMFLIPFLSIGGLIIIYVYDKYGKNTESGMNMVFETAQGKNDKIPLRLVPLITISTWITHLFGGSAGREGVAVQIGATISDFFS